MRGSCLIRGAVPVSGCRAGGSAGAAVGELARGREIPKATALAGACRKRRPVPDAWRAKRPRLSAVASRGRGMPALPNPFFAHTRLACGRVVAVGDPRENVVGLAPQACRADTCLCACNRASVAAHAWATWQHSHAFSVRESPRCRGKGHGKEVASELTIGRRWNSGQSRLFTLEKGLRYIFPWLAWTGNRV